MSAGVVRVLSTQYHPIKSAVGSVGFSLTIKNKMPGSLCLRYYHHKAGWGLSLWPRLDFRGNLKRLLEPKGHPGSLHSLRK